MPVRKQVSITAGRVDTQFTVGYRPQPYLVYPTFTKFLSY